jgi:hypothetical protein
MLNIDFCGLFQITRNNLKLQILNQLKLFNKNF